MLQRTECDFIKAENIKLLYSDFIEFFTEGEY